MKNAHVGIRFIDIIIKSQNIRKLCYSFVKIYLYLFADERWPSNSYDGERSSANRYKYICESLF